MKVNLLSLFLSSFLIYSCAGTAEMQRSWDTALKNHTTSSYENFLTEYPDSKYSEIARQKLETLYELKAWNVANRYNTISGHERFIVQYPNSMMKQKALDKIDELKIENEWNLAKTIDTKESYKNFIDKHPLSVYKSKAQEKINFIEENETWNIAENINSINSYEEYLDKYSNGRYFNVAKNRIDEIKTILPEWNSVLKKNSLPAYRDFISKYPLSSYSQTAKEKIKEIEESDWDKTVRQNSIKGYQKFINDYPASIYRSIADGSIIDLEVDKIFKGDHGNLPPSTKISDNYNRSFGVVNIYNTTKYKLTVRYSGAESFKVEFAPDEKGSIELKEGNYRVTASVNASRVQDYAGTENFVGADYNIVYYISTNNQDKSYQYQKYLYGSEIYPTKRRIIK